MNPWLRELLPPLAVRAGGRVRRMLRPPPPAPDGLDDARPLTIGDLTISAPAGHILHRTAADQPFRDTAVGLAARAVLAERPGSTVLDVGANIGDTAAHVRRFSDAVVHCVEPHPGFLRYLLANAPVIGNVGGVYAVMVGDGRPVRGEWVVGHGSTASFRDAANGAEVRTVRLPDLNVPDVGLLKVDADGADAAILEAHLDWLADARPVLLFEAEARDRAEEARLARLLAALSAAGYRDWLAFDDRGYLLTGTADVGLLADLVRYQRVTWQHDPVKRIVGYDLLAVPAEWRPVYDRVRAEYPG